MDGRGMDPEHSGILLAAQPLVMAIVASPSGWLSDKYGPRPLAVLGLFILAIALGGLATLGMTTSRFMIAFWLSLTGLGTGIFISPNSSALMGSAPPGSQGVASGLMSLSRNIGMMIGIAAATVLFQTMGGQTGGAWTGREYGALNRSFAVAAAVTALTIAMSSFAARNIRKEDKATGLR
jgi:MFS family permease